MKLLSKLGLIIVFTIIFITDAQAVSLKIINYPSEITRDVFTVTASISGNLTGTNYLRIDLYKENTSNYFGETFNSSIWYGGSDSLQYFPINYENGLWSGNIEGRVGNPTQTEFPSSGNYNLKIRRYTASGNYNSSESLDSLVNLLINIEVPTITVANTPIPSNTRVPTSTIIITKQPTIKPTVVKKPTIIPSPTDIITGSVMVLGESNEISPSPSVKPLPLEKDPVFGTKIALVLGLLFLGAGIIIFSQRIGEMQKNHEKN